MIELCQSKGDFVVRKRLKIGIVFIIILLLTACMNKEATPEDRLTNYIDLWKQQEWSTMYEEYITNHAKEKFGKEEFIERTEKIYKDLKIDTVDIKFEEPNKKKKESKEEGTKLPVKIDMKTVAGKVTFEKNVALIYEEQDGEKSWYVDWDPSFNLPNLTMDDKIAVAPIIAKRGEIYDRHEKPLAINGSGAEVGVIAGSFNADADAGKLADLLGTTGDFIHQQLNQNWVESGHLVPLKKIPFTKQSQYEEAIQIAGVTAVKADMREYPYAHALAHLIGYTGPINAEELEELKDEGYAEGDIVGKRGLEQLLEARLRGTDGIALYIEKDGESEERITVAEKPAVDGETVSITVDADFQKIIYEEMHDERGTAAVVEPKTGETLALVSAPSFDPNEFALGVSAARYQALTDDPAEPMLNRFSSTYAPGSSIKPITAAIGLTAGTLKPEETHTIEGNKWRKNNSWGNFQVSRVHTTPNPVDLKKGLIYSDNIYFAKEALKLKQKPFMKGLKQYGFEEDMPFSYPMRASQISNDGKIESEGQLVDTSFGQGQMLMNILHLASTYEAILNEGTMMKPILFMDEEKGEVWKEDLLSAEHADILKEALRAVVTDGFAQEANIEAIAISGKTGTAELKQSLEGRGKENGFFVAYPTETEDYIIAMMIEGIEDKNGSGYVAGKVAKAMERK